MSEPISPAAITTQESNGQTPTPTPPPWGADFDPARAWHTIQTLREREKELAKQPRMSAEQQQQLSEYQSLVQAGKSEAQRLSEAAESARLEATQARADAVRYKAAATYGITADHFDLLGTGSEEEVIARAEKLQALLAAQTATPPAPSTRRPTEQLRGGATPSETESEEDVVYARLFGAPQ